MERSRHVGIVGCGIAGAACALMLARSGFRVSLFEQTFKVGPEGAGVLLQPSGQRVLAELGLLQQLLPGAERIDCIHAVTESGADLVRLRYDGFRPGLFGIGLHRGDLFSPLHGGLAAAGVDLQLGITADNVRQIDQRPVLVDSTGQLHGPFDILIAADGSRSRLRRACELGARVIEYDYGALWTVGDVAPISNKLFQAAHGTEQLGGMLPVGRGRCSLFWGCRRDQVQALRDRGFEQWREAVVRLMPPAQPLVDRIATLEAARFVTYRHVSAHRRYRGKVVFIGDAAHSMSPHLGQGVNLALRDAQELSAAIERCRTSEEAFDRYERRRRRAIGYYSAVTAFLSPFFQSHGTILGNARNIALPMLSRFPPTRRLMLKTLCGVR